MGRQGLSARTLPRWTVVTTFSRLRPRENASTRQNRGASVVGRGIKWWLISHFKSFTRGVLQLCVGRATVMLRPSPPGFSVPLARLPELAAVAAPFNDRRSQQVRAYHRLSLMSWSQVFGINYTDSWLC